MTLIISMCTKSGMYMIADRKLTKYYQDSYEDAGKIQKIVQLNNKVMLSFWGNYELKEDKKISDLLLDFKKEINPGETIEIISEKLKSFFEKKQLLDFDDELGFHLTGYDLNNNPCLKHIFHTKWLQNNQFINEDSRYNYHESLSKDENIKMVGYRENVINNPFPMLFNGENSLPNLVINGITLYKDSINYWDFNESEAKEFLIYLLDCAIKLEKFRKHFKNMKNNIIDYPLDFCSVTNSGIKTEEIK